ncbi:MAG: sulfatase-like hydrolase/transferase [Saprospiraceae bacterium]|nr:sulfatase-like hydrolase/transferase [Saprospiraceae bacterium]
MRIVLSPIFKRYLSLLLIISPYFLSGQPTRPNVVFILADDLGYGDLAGYGHRHIATPHLDRLAQEGLKLTQFYSPSPLCSPARAGFLTGRTPYRTGIKSWIPQGEDIYLHQEELTLASLLKQHGYQTFLSGKWHLNGGLEDDQHPQPDDHGFDKWLALHGFATPNHQNPNNFYEDGKALGQTEGFAAEIAVDKAIEYIDDRNDQNPFFLFLSLAEPHSEIASPDEFNERYQEFTEGEIDLEQLENRGPGEYYANVTHMDFQIGRLLRKIKDLQLDENTIVIFTSDNGPVTTDWRNWWEVNMYGETGGLRGRKGDLYEGGLRVPCLIRYPKTISPATVSEEPTHGYDLLPTLCSLLDIPLPKNRPIDGVDISPLFQQAPLERKEPLFWAFRTALGNQAEVYHYAVRWNQWKMIATASLDKTLLYDLEEDPYETRELSKQYPEVVSKLKAFIQTKKISIANDPLRPTAQYEQFKELTLLYTNDIESVYDPIDAYWNDTIQRIGGMAHLATLIEQVRKKETSHFLFDAGDIFTGALSKATYGKLPFDLYSAMGYECLTLGNHEFEYGWQKLLESKQRARFPVLNANIFYQGTDINYGQSYTILEKDGLRVGLIGVMGVEAFKNTIYPGNVLGLEVRPPIPIVQKWVDKLKPEVDLIVVLTHQNKSAPMQSDKEVDESVQRGFDEDYEMAGTVKGIDVLLGGHSDHGLWEPVRHPTTGTLIGITFGQGKYLGYMRLAIDQKNKKVELREGKLIPVIAEKLPPDPKISKLIEQARKANPHLIKIIGTNLRTGYRKYNAESNLGNFIADVTRTAATSDIGMANPGSIRADLDVGDITVEEIVNIYPFIDELVTVEIDGNALRDLLEYSATLTYGLVQLSGIDIQYDFRKPLGQRLIKATINGQQIQDKKKYTIACSAFVAGGGDGFSMLKAGKVLHRSKKRFIDFLLEHIEREKELVLPAIGRQQIQQ